MDDYENRKVQKARVGGTRILCVCGTDALPGTTTCGALSCVALAAAISVLDRFERMIALLEKWPHARAQNADIMTDAVRALATLIRDENLPRSARERAAELVRRARALKEERGGP